MGQNQIVIDLIPNGYNLYDLATSDESSAASVATACSIARGFEQHPAGDASSNFDSYRR